MHEVLIEVRIQRLEFREYARYEGMGPPDWRCFDVEILSVPMLRLIRLVSGQRLEQYLHSEFDFDPMLREIFLWNRYLSRLCC